MDKTAKIDLYTLLDVPRTATREQIKKQYRKMCLLVHPDKNPNDPKANEKFCNLNNAYKILIDEERRKLYDETGEYDENETGDIDLENTYNYYREIYPKLRIEDIEEFAAKYKDSSMEKDDLIAFYNENKGNLTNILTCIPLSDNNDIPRFIQIYNELINSGKLKKEKMFAKTKKHIKKLTNDEAKLAGDELNSLQQAILAKTEKRKKGDYFENLLNKYGGKEEKYEEISEEEFNKARERLKKKKKK